MINNIEGQSKAELIKIIEIQQEHDVKAAAEITRLQGEVDKANERIKELEKNQLPIENGKNRYALDVSYFRNAINRELNRPLDNYKPDELARVFARLSRTADESVMFEPEFSNKFAIEQKIEAFEKYADMCKAFRTKPSIESLRHHIEQLRKGGES